MFQWKSCPTPVRDNGQYIHDFTSVQLKNLNFNIPAWLRFRVPRIVRALSRARWSRDNASAAAEFRPRAAEFGYRLVLLLWRGECHECCKRSTPLVTPR